MIKRIKTFIFFVHVSFLAPGGATISFQDLLHQFRDCSITYFNFPTLLPPNVLVTNTTDQIKVQTQTVSRILVSQLTISPSAVGVPCKTRSCMLSTYKYSHCTVSIFPLHDASSSVAITKILSHYYAFYTEFVWLLRASNLENLEKPEDYYAHLLASQRPLIYLEIVDLSSISFVCLRCVNLNALRSEQAFIEMRVPNLGKINDPTLDGIRRSWMKQHLNMQGVNVMVPQLAPTTIPEYFHKEQAVPCGVFPDETKYFDPSECTVILLSAHYNFTIVSPETQQFNEIHSIITFNIYVTKENLEMNDMYGDAVCIYGVEQIPYAFIILKDKEEMLRNQEKLKGILAPFPWWVWISIGLISFASSLLLDYKYKFEQSIKRSILTSLKLWFKTTSLLLEQANSEIPGNGGWRKLKLWSVWALFSLVISHGYRGFLFSALATAITPSTPQTIGELVNSGMLVLTIDIFASKNGTEIISQPTLTHDIVPRIIENNTNIAARDVWLALQVSTQWLRYTWNISSFTVGISKQKLLTIGKWNENLTAPNEFAIIDQMAKASRFQTLLEEAGTYWVSKQVVEPRLQIYETWLISNNYFQSIFTMYLARVYESGLHQRWKKFSALSESKIDKRMVRILMFDSKESRETRLDEHTVSKKVFLEILIHYVAFIGTALFAFVLESICQCFNRLGCAISRKITAHPSR